MSSSISQKGKNKAQLKTEGKGNEWLLFKYKSLKQTIKKYSKMGTVLNMKDGGKDIMDKLYNYGQKLREAERELVIRNVPEFKGGLMFRNFHVHCSTGYSIIDTEISKFITKFVLSSGFEAYRPSFDEILEEVSIIACENDIELNEKSLNQMSAKVYVDMTKQYKDRSRKETNSKIFKYCQEEEEKELQSEMQANLLAGNNSSDDPMDNILDELITGQIGEGSQLLTSISLQFGDEPDDEETQAAVSTIDSTSLDDGEDDEEYDEETAAAVDTIELRSSDEEEN